VRLTILWRVELVCGHAPVL